MKGGKKGLLVNSRNLCSGKPGRMTVSMIAPEQQALRHPAAAEEQLRQGEEGQEASET
jgi:hypothetical protein